MKIPVFRNLTELPAPTERRKRAVQIPPYLRDRRFRDETQPVTPTTAREKP